MTSFESWLIMGRRKRTVVGKGDLQKLETLFEIERWPSKEQKQELATELGKSEYFINTWFQNKRAKIRKLLQEHIKHYSDMNDSERKRSLKYHGVNKKRFKYETYDNRNRFRESINTESHHQKDAETEDMPDLYTAPTWQTAFSRIVNMCAAAEDVLLPSHVKYSQAVDDVERGIKIKDGTIVYDPAYGVDIVQET